MFNGSLTDIKGILVGSAQNTAARTGCTVILCPEGAVASADVRGGGTGTRETDIFREGMMMEKIHGVFLAGGSAFGLDVGGGVMKYLEEQGVGFDVGVAKVPIVSGAILFDLAVGESGVRPDGEMGYEACQNASGCPVRQGPYGAGAGATVGKALGFERASDAGLGSASITLPDGAVIAALAAVNALGDVYDYTTNKIIAGVRTKDGYLNTCDYLLSKRLKTPASFACNTTIGVIATNAALTKNEAKRLAIMAHDGYALAIRPVHTPMDGDTVFALCTGEVKAEPTALFTAAGIVMARAIANSIYARRE
jgi:L-aminopeptidase/D-esterase-like protein